MVYVHVMTSPFAGVMVFDVPLPEGNVVLEPLAVLEQLIELVYAPMVETDPAAIVSVRV